MVDSTSVSAAIRDGERYVFNFTEKLENTNDLGCLIAHLEEAKCRVNEYLTTLVEKQGNKDLTEDQAMSDSESSSSEDIEVNPKKSKLVD